ncbi:MAG: DMT family transporter [Bacteroidota bacterium]
MRRRAEFLLFLTTFVWGSTFVTVKIAMMEVAPLLLTSVRFAIACAIAIPIWHKQIRGIRFSVFKKGLILGLLLSVGFILQTIGLQMTTASKTAFITGMMVVFTPIAQVVIERRAPRLGNIIGILLVIGGLWLLTSPDGSAFNLGDGLTLMAAVLFGIYIVYVDVYSKQHDVSQLFFLQLFVTLVVSFGGTLVFEDLSFHPSSTVLALIIYLAVFATVISTFIQTKYQRETTPTRAVLIFALEPVIAATLAYLILDERIGVLGILGGALIISGVLASEFSDSFKKILVWMGWKVEEVPSPLTPLSTGERGVPTQSGRGEDYESKARSEPDKV